MPPSSIVQITIVVAGTGVSIHPKLPIMSAPFVNVRVIIFTKPKNGLWPTSGKTVVMTVVAGAPPVASDASLELIGVHASGERGSHRDDRRRDQRPPDGEGVGRARASSAEGGGEDRQRDPER